MQSNVRGWSWIELATSEVCETGLVGACVCDLLSEKLWDPSADKKLLADLFPSRLCGLRASHGSQRRATLPVKEETKSDNINVT